MPCHSNIRAQEPPTQFLWFHLFVVWMVLYSRILNLFSKKGLNMAVFYSFSHIRILRFRILEPWWLTRCQKTINYGNLFATCIIRICQIGPKLHARLPRFEILVSRVTTQTAPTFQQNESNLTELSFSPLTDNHHTGNVYGVKNSYSERGYEEEMK